MKKITSALLMTIICLGFLVVFTIVYLKDINNSNKINNDVSTAKTNRSFATNIKKYNAIINKLKIFLRKEVKTSYKPNKQHIEQIEAMIKECKDKIRELQYSKDNNITNLKQAKKIQGKAPFIV